MPREINRLSARKAETEQKPGRHPDGGGLYLSISTNGGRRWVFLYRRGKLREMGLGSARAVTLAAARKKAAAARAELAEGRDPIAGRKAALVRLNGITFGECASRYIEAHQASWKNPKHKAQWRQTIKVYAEPQIGTVPVAAIDTAAVMRCVQPIWQSKNETAARLRGRIEQILDWARVSGHREGDNPARWRGHLDKLLPRRSAVSKVRHHPALPYKDIPKFMARLMAQGGIAAESLAFTILTAARTSETTGAAHKEFHLSEALWTVPAARMKGDRLHRVPLADAAVAIVRKMARVSEIGFVFPGGRPKRPQSENAMLALLQRMGSGEITVHGFRSTFRDWASEVGTYPNEVVEMALAHAIESDTEAAYRRGDMLEKRRVLMQDWAAYCLSAVQ